ncbi:TetR/AcrR family transcriptional regulator [Sciscionella sediminilitoris]|uniref:TetR/AcrR family transcriptional regulator n=1 Tax=Sciscionella sediminilitoris TaxID=1445613 RepID=UPI0004DFC10C|nr:TetR/AcrR family transcriptional regulator C-terminal domain-containing protein [Sciscionella sp. SE31]
MAPAKGRSGSRPRRPRDSLSREKILAVAEELAAEGGFSALTFQAIGDKLRAHPTSIYRHFRDKDELLLELVDSLRARSYFHDLVASDDWLDDIRRTGQLIRAHYLRYPAFALEMAMRTTRRPTEFHNVEFTLDALRRGGIPDEEAVVLMRAMGNFLRSIASAEAAYRAMDESLRQRDEVAWQLEYRQLDPGEYPNITRVADKLLNLGDPMGFETALELMLEGIAAHARAATGQSAD